MSLSMDSGGRKPLLKYSTFHCLIFHNTAQYELQIFYVFVLKLLLLVQIYIKTISYSVTFMSQ